MTALLQERVAAVEDLLARPDLPPPAVRKKLRKAARPRLTQEDVGRAIGVTRSQVIRWESGESDPTKLHHELYARLLNGLAEKYPEILEEEASVSP